MTAWSPVFTARQRWQPAGNVTVKGRSFAAESQPNSSWCWLACTVTVDRANGGVNTQCGLAHQLVGNTVDCCQSPRHQDCDQAGDVGVALQHINRLKQDDHLQGQAPALPPIANAVANGNPPVLVIRLLGGVHAVALVGTGTDGNGDDTVRYGDPQPGWTTSDVVWSQAKYYRGGVSWRRIVWTC